VAGFDRFLDVGANVGQYACLANRSMRNGEIVCIEANAGLIPILEENLSTEAAQNARGNRFVVLNKVVIDEARQCIPFFLTGKATTSSIFGTRAADRESVTYVDGLPLGELAEENRRTYVKMDIEGGEYRALLGAGGLLTANTVWLIEVHPWGDPELRVTGVHLAEFMSRRGLQIRKVSPGYFFGSHYEFRRASRARCTASLLLYAPALYVRYLVNGLNKRHRRWLREHLRPRRRAGQARSRGR
jgi:FkbM family methyltransferase